MNDQTRTDIILAALNAVGPVTEPTTNAAGALVASAGETWEFAVEQKAMEIMLMTAPDSRLTRRLGLVSSAHDRDNKTSKAFSGVITDVTIEQPSTRALVSVKSPSGNKPIETARTDRTDTAFGALMARRAHALIGHRVMVYLEMEEFVGRNGDSAGQVVKSRTIRHLVDLGPSQPS